MVLSHSKCSELIWIVSACYVPVFFVCSGYTLKRKENQTFKEFVSQKCRRLLLPYLFCMVLIVAFNFIVGKILHQPFDGFRSTIGALYSRAELFPHGTENNILMLPMNSQPMWFLTALLVTIIAAYPLLKWNRDKKVVAITSVFLLILAFLFTELPVLLPWSTDCVPAFLLMILFGYWVREKEWMNLPRWYYAVMLTIYVVILYFNDTVNFSVRQYGNSVTLAVVSSLLGSLLLMKLSQHIEKVKVLRQPLAALGRHSLYIMCFHLPVLTVCAKIISGSSYSGPVLYALYLASVIIAIIAGYVLSLLVQRYILFLK